MTSLPLRSGYASTTNSARAGLEYGQVVRMTVRASAQYGWVRFPFGTQLRPGVTIQSATLQLVQVGSWSTAVIAQRASKTWKPKTLNATSSIIPGVVGSPVTATRTGTLLEFNVATDVQTMLDTNTNFGWRISTTDATGREIRGFESSTGTPVLVIEYSYKPAAPTNLNPSGGSVSITKPTLQFDAGDTAALQVQIDPTGAFTSPTYDSGWQTTTAHEWNLLTSTYGGNSSGSTIWRAKVRNAAGVESDWSAGATWTYAAKATASLSQPGATIWESSPPFDLDMTGLVAARFFVAKESDPSTILYDSGLVPTTTGQHTPSRPVFTEDGVLYRVTGWGFDAVAREDTPGDTPYSVATTTTTLAYDATVADVVGLSVSQDADSPGMVGVFTRAVAPDAFTIERDGVTIYDQVPYSTLLESGTSYVFYDWTARPNVQNTYTVRAVVNGQASAGRDFTITPRVASRWLVDPVTGDAVVLHGKSKVAWSHPEQAVVHELENGKVVRRRLSRGTGRGSIEGMLIEALAFPGLDTATMAAALEAWAAGDPGKVFRLIYNDVNVGVWLGNVEVTNAVTTSSADPIKDVYVDLWEAS